MIKIDQIDHINRFLKKEEKEIQRKEEKHKRKKRENQNFWGHECGQTEVVLISKGVVRQKVVLILERWRNKREEYKQNSYSRFKFNNVKKN